MAGLNKRILCFVDECGTAGDERFALGCVMAWARDCGRADKAFSDILEANAGEVHAVKRQKESLQSMLGLYAQTDHPDMVMLNRLGTITTGTRPAVYAANVVETVKVAVGQFRTLHKIGGNGIKNVELIMDRNHHNTDAECLAALEHARQTDGRFRAVDTIVQIDSAASRLLQLADVVAYSRMWIHNDEENAKGLHNNYGIQVL
ncbi:DUF3800 domain-containing protein [Celeribacter sp. ULVN23_4]